MSQVTNDAGLSLIKSFEGCRLKAYKLDGESYYTIGYGHSFDNSITASTVWTQAQADAALRKDLGRYEGYVAAYASTYKMSFNDNQFAALVSYCYNRGPGGLKQLLSHSASVADVANNIVVYWGSAVRYKTGLVRRREAEKALFLKPVPAPKPVQPKKEEDDMLAKAVCYNSLADIGVAEFLAGHLGTVTVQRAVAMKVKVAKELVVVGGTKDGLKADTFTVLSGPDRFATTEAVNKYLASK
jgi:GH24 family phage-related lysozyme (muramidase)